jgi:threonine dehydratase
VLGLEDIRSAADAIGNVVERTPCTHSRTLSALCGAEIFCKFENLQFTASFKDRGAAVKLLALTQEERRRGVVAVSAGNHAQAVAYHAQRLGIAATIVMPRFTPNVKVEHSRGLGAHVILHGATLSIAASYARELADTRSLVLIHPYDDERVIAGQGTVVLEMLEQQPEIEALVIPVGGGGLIAGCAIAARELRPDVEILGVQTATFPSMKQALAGEPITCGAHTIAEGIAVKEPGTLTFPIVRTHVSDIVLVDEHAIEEAVLLLLEIEKTVVEGAGAAALAAVLTYPSRFAGRKVGVVLSGGNIDLMILSAVIQRGLVRTARLVRLVVEMRDVPGALAELAAIFGKAGASIIEIRHQRTFTGAPLQVAEVEVVLETRGKEHADEVLAELREAGYTVRVGAMPNVQRAR